MSCQDTDFSSYLIILETRFSHQYYPYHLLCYTSVKARYQHQSNASLQHTWIKKHEMAFIESLARRVGQDRNCHWKSSLLNCWLLLAYFSCAILVHIIQWKVAVTFIATFNILTQNNNLVLVLNIHVFNEGAYLTFKSIFHKVLNLF